MAEKELAPFSQSSNTENEFSQDKSVGFSTPMGSSSAIEGEIIENTISLTNTTTNLVMPTSPHGAPSKRSRGRPKGSKNKPKPPVVITKEPESFMEQIFIEVSAGCDVVESIIKMAWHHQADISVMRGFGLVSDITIRNSTPHSSTLTIEGPVQMMSLSGTYINPNSNSVPFEFVNNPAYSSFSIFLSGNGGQVYGGIVIGKIMTSGVVMITATVQKKSKFYRVSSS